MRRALLLGAALLALAAPRGAWSYELLGAKWPTPTATLDVDIPDPNDPWNAAFEEALAEWGLSGDFSYQIVHSFADPCSDPNINPPINGVAFRGDNCGVVFQPATLALTILWATEKPGPMLDNIIQASIVFNENVNFAVYEGPGVSNPRDFRRVAVHELGHVCGLAHTLTLSVMQAAVGDIEVPQIDDFDGVANLYGNGTAAGVLSVAQRGLFAATGPVGGPFDPNSAPTYTASNNGELDLSFAVTANVGWLDVPSGSVMLPGGDPNANSTEIPVYFGPSAALLGAGVHVATLSFTNLTTGNGDTTRIVELSLELPDADGDGVPDATDNCVTLPNSMQTNSDLPPAGDACQCSDLDADAQSDIVDAVLMERFRMGASLPAGVDGTRCAVDAGVSPCGATGIVAVRQTLAAAGPPLVESCPAP